jgi:hypothetical protein
MTSRKATFRRHSIGVTEAQRNEMAQEPRMNSQETATGPQADVRGAAAGLRGRPVADDGIGQRGTGSMRLLPWSGEGGKPYYLDTDGPDSYLSRLADELEAVQTGMGEDLLDHVQKILAAGTASEPELRNLVEHLCQALRDALRVAESRGARLPAPDTDALVATVQSAIDREIIR